MQSEFCISRQSENREVTESESELSMRERRYRICRERSGEVCRADRREERVEERRRFVREETTVDPRGSGC